MEALSKILRISLVAVLLFAVFQGQAQEQQKLVSFTIKNAGINVKGSFLSYSVTTKWDASDLSNSRLSATIEANTIDTGIKGRDKHLRKAKYFDVENYPQIRLESTSISKTDAGYLLKGKLTIKETTLPVEIPFTTRPSAEGIVFSGAFELDRRDYGVGKNHLIMGDEVKIEIYHLEKYPSQSPLKGEK